MGYSPWGRRELDIAALFTTDGMQEQPTRPSMYEWRNRMRRLSGSLAASRPAPALPPGSFSLSRKAMGFSLGS